MHLITVIQRVRPVRGKHMLADLVAFEVVAVKILGEAVRHVHAEAVRPQPEPEVHDVLDEQPALHRFGGVGGELPVFGDGAESVVEACLRGEAVHGRRVGTFRNASEESAD